MPRKDGDGGASEGLEGPGSQSMEETTGFNSRMLHMKKRMLRAKRLGQLTQLAKQRTDSGLNPNSPALQ